MIFELLVTADTGKVRNEVRAGTRVTAMRTHSTVLEMRVLADAGSAPSIDVEAFSAHHPVLPNLFWAPRYELECLAFALGAVIFHTAIFKDSLVVELEQVSTEASRVGPDAKALVFALRVTLPGDVDSRFHCFVCVAKLPRHHFLGTRGHANLLHQLQYLLLVLRLYHLFIIYN